MRALVIVEHDKGNLKQATLNTVRAALDLKAEVDAIVLGQNCDAVAKAACQIEGVQKVICVSSSALEHQLPEVSSQAILEIAKDYHAILAPATTFGKNLLPRIAVKLDVMQLSDVIKVHDQDTFDRPIYAGNAIQTVKSADAIKIMTVRTTAFEPVALGAGNASLETRDFNGTFAKARFVKVEASESARPELSSAKIVVSGGRGLGSKENFSLVEQLADCLNAAIGASRAAVDAGYVPNDYQVGQTGKVVAPGLYIAIGISGAIQHLAGMKDSKVIVAINKDPDAPIFQVADYGLVGDLFEILPVLTKELCQKG